MSAWEGSAWQEAVEDERARRPGNDRGMEQSQPAATEVVHYMPQGLPPCITVRIRVATDVGQVTCLECLRRLARNAICSQSDPRG